SGRPCSKAGTPSPMVVGGRGGDDRVRSARPARRVHLPANRLWPTRGRAEQSEGESGPEGERREIILPPDGKHVRIRAGANQTLEVSGPDYEPVRKSFDLMRGGVATVQVP